MAIASAAVHEADMRRANAGHVSVLLESAVASLRPETGGVFVDATLGPGGHAEALLDRSGPHGHVIGIDKDPAAIAAASERLAGFGPRFDSVRGDYEDIALLLQSRGVATVDGVLADLGISSAQLDDPLRGFSFSTDGPLDMRLDPSSGDPTAADLIARLDGTELREIIATWGEERLAGPIARAIVRERAKRPIVTTTALASLVERAAGPAARRFRIHPATRTFQALRIAVNREILGIPEFINAAVSLLRPSGRLAIISFHSLEDRAVKTTFQHLSHRCVCPPGLPVCGCGREDIVRSITSHPITPDPSEIESNPRSRSAKLRIVERL